MIIKSLAVSALALTIFTAPAIAGSPAPAPADPVIPAAIPVSPDWTGAYVGTFSVTWRVPEGDWTGAYLYDIAKARWSEVLYILRDAY